MAFSDYFKQLDDGRVALVLDELSSTVFVDAVKVVDVYKANILGRQSRKGIVEPGSGDVRLTSMSGKTVFISRQQLAKQFTHPSGKKLTLATLKSDKDYLVIRPCNERYKALKIPDNCIGDFKGRQVRFGNYVIAKVTEDGSIDRDSITVISEKMFKKTFKIPMQHIIMKHANNTNKGSNINVFKIRGGRANNSFGGYKPIINTAEIGLNPRNIKLGGESKVDRENTVVRNTDAVVNRSSYKYKAVCRLFTFEGTKKLYGFGIEELETGKYTQITVPQMTKLCASKLVENVMIVSKEDGSRYLRGNGIEISTLPERIV